MSKTKPLLDRMKNNKRKMCEECPFRKNSMPGYLGPHTAQGLFEIVHGEGGFACHSHIDAVKGAGEDIKTVPLEQCAGAILHANKSCKSYHNPKLRAHQLALKNSPELENTLGLREFKQHHEDSEEAKKFLAFSKKLKDSEVKHDKDCHLGDNYKDCPACMENEDG